MCKLVCVVLLLVCILAVSAAQNEFFSQVVREFNAKLKRKVTSRNLSRVADKVSQQAPPKNADVVWSRHSDFGIYESCGISAATEYVMAGTTDVYTQTNPDDAELVPFASATPAWVYSEPNVNIAIQRAGPVAAACSWDDQTITLNCAKWTAGHAANPDWNVIIPNSFPTESTVAISKDGKKIAILTSLLEFMNPNNTRAYIYDAASGKKLQTIETVFGARHAVLTSDGSRIAFHANTSIFIYDAVSGKNIQVLDVGYSDYNLAISDDGTYLVSGFMSVDVYKWNKQTEKYENIWSAINPNHYVENSVIASSGQLAVAWSSFDAEQPSVQAYNIFKGSAPLWTYQYEESVSLQDIPSSISITTDGLYFVVGSWGNMTETNPEVRVWNFNKQQPIWTLKTSGSVFAVDIATSATKPGTLDVVAGCKATHANQMGRGGDLYYSNIKAN